MYVIVIGVPGFFFNLIEIESEIDIIVGDGYGRIFYYLGINIIVGDGYGWIF